MAINENCTSIQTFCKIAGQTVGQLMPFNYTIDITKNETEIQEEIWNAIITKIKDIYNYGTRGTRNPAKPLEITSFKTVQDNHEGKETINSSIIDVDDSSYTKYIQNAGNFIPRDQYNTILKTIGSTNSAGLGTIITKAQFDSIKDTINKITIHESRCNNCNTGCNTSCQNNCNTNCYCYDCYCYDCYSKCEGTDCPSTYCINFM